MHNSTLVICSCTPDRYKITFYRSRRSISWGILKKSIDCNTIYCESCNPVWHICVLSTYCFLWNWLDLRLGNIICCIYMILADKSIFRCDQLLSYFFLSIIFYEHILLPLDFHLFLFSLQMIMLVDRNRMFRPKLIDIWAAATKHYHVYLSQVWLYDCTYMCYCRETKWAIHTTTMS